MVNKTIVKSEKVSVIIPTHNSWKTLKSCVESVKKQTIKPFEIIVVDNASSDGTSANVKKYFPKVKLVTLQTNKGVTGGRNAGIMKAREDNNYLLFFDHDMVADKNMIKQLVKVSKKSNGIGIVTPKIYYWDDKNYIWSAGTGINLWTGQILFRGGKDIGQFDKTQEVQVAPACLLVKKKVIDKVNAFDDRYFAVYEDTDFCFRARDAGYKTFYSPEAIAYHKLSLDPRDEADRLLSRGFWIGRNRVWFMKDYAINFFVFSMFIPAYLLYYLKHGLKYGDLKGWINFVRGTFIGLLS